MTLANMSSLLLGIYLYKKLFHDFLYKKLFITKEEQQRIGLSHILKITPKETYTEVTTTVTQKETPIVTKPSKPNIICYGRPVVGTELSFILDSSDVFGVTVECIDGYDDGYGIYKEVYYDDNLPDIPTWGSKLLTSYKCMLHYNVYEPYRCRICGAPINDKNAFHNPLTKGKINTAILPDSELRLCDNCKDIFREDTEDYFPFFMDFQNKKVVTSWENKEEFLQYMKRAYFVSAVAWDVYNETDIHGMYETFGYTIDESLANLTRLEYTKNADTAAMYNSVRGLI